MTRRQLLVIPRCHKTPVARHFGHDLWYLHPYRRARKRDRHLGCVSSSAFLLRYRKSGVQDLRKSQGRILWMLD